MDQITTPESYITSDDSLETTEELTTKSITEQVLAQKHSLEPIEEEEEEDFDDEVPLPVTLTDRDLHGEVVKISK